jgi:peptidoglycan LD-endopeptidase CwlK
MRKHEEVDMTRYKLSSRSIDNLQGVHPDLAACVVLALYKYSTVDFTVLEGVRSPETQRVYFDEGVSWTLKSRHLIQKDGTGHAVDLAPWANGAIPWEKWELFEATNKAMQQAAGDLGITVKWGGEWKSKDGPHYQIMGGRR